MLYLDPDEDRVATPQEACREYAHAVGFDNMAAGREQPAWILTNWDSWEPNPFYTGPKVRHPEDDSDEEVPLNFCPQEPSQDIPF